MNDKLQKKINFELNPQEHMMIVTLMNGYMMVICDQSQNLKTSLLILIIINIWTIKFWSSQD